MPDDGDDAQRVEELLRRAALGPRKTALSAIGRCYSCDDEVPPGRQFCDRDCLDDWERYEAARKRGGKTYG